MTAARARHADDDATDAQVARAALWGSLRLAVVDIETCNAADGDHIIDIAVLTCKRGIDTGEWPRKLDPGVPIDDRSQQVHGITDEEVAGAQTFAQVADELTRLLTSRDGEQVVLVAHNAPFDVSRLQLEYERIGQTMPDLAVLDTRALSKDVGLRTGTLASLLSALDLRNPAAHTALGDATATARAAMAMLVMAAHAGEHDFAALLARTMRGRAARTSDIKAAGRNRRRPSATSHEPFILLPPAHLRGHSELLNENPDRAALAAWQEQARECADLRCPDLHDRVAVVPVTPQRALALLEPVLDAALTAGNPGSVATIVGALTQVLDGAGSRSGALAWDRTWGPRLRAVGACDSKEPCPWCSSGQPCPLDTWQPALAAIALGTLTRQSQRSFLHTMGAHVGKGVFTTWAKAGHGQLAGHAAWLVHEAWRAESQAVQAEALARYAWLAGGRDPRLSAVHARNTAAPGSKERLMRGIAVCDEALLSRGGSTDDGWTALLATRGRLAGQLTRRTSKPSGQLDEDGNPIPVRRHHPGTPERSRPSRFT